MQIKRRGIAMDMTDFAVDAAARALFQKTLQGCYDDASQST
jgi:hypothetical protein